MFRFKTYLAAASAMACLVAPASASPQIGANGKSLNGLEFNAVTQNAVTQNAIFANGLGVLALNGVHADGIVLAKSLATTGKSVVDPNDRSVVDPNERSLPAALNGKTQPSTAGKKSNGVPASQYGVGGGDGTNHGRPTPTPRR